MNRLLLNLGCGERTHPEWVNIDFSLRNRLRKLPLLRGLVGGRLPPGYRNHDLRHGIPYPDGAADAVYSSHVLEHLRPAVVPQALREMHRVLKPGAVLRLVVPDLEYLARHYLEALDRARRASPADPEAALAHEWSVIWLLDQLVRERTGGEMVRWLRARRDTPFVRELGGVMLEVARTPAPHEFAGFRRLVRRVAEGRRAEGTGELHLWMYDEHSLTLRVREAGFSEVRRVRVDESRIPDWNAFGLDLNSDGRPHQPGSLWMEAVK